MQKPALSYAQIWNMSIGFFGIQVGFALQNANVSRIFQTLGAEIDDLAILWIAAPMTGLLVQPIIGYLSDRTWNRFGRRRPYFMVGAIFASAALLVMPNSPYLWVAAGMLWIMDASINITMEPFRAFVGDLLPDEQRTRGFSMQTFFIGTGSVLASAMPYILANWVGISNTAPDGVVPPSVEYSFYVGAFFMLTTVLWTVMTTKEYSPEEMAAFEAVYEEHAAADKAITAKVKPSSSFINLGITWLVLGVLSTYVIASYGLEKELYVLSICGAGFGFMQVAAGFLQKRGQTDNAFSEIINDLFDMPQSMRQLALVQFLSWFALFSMWIYTTGAVTSFHFGTTDPTSQAYAAGADWVGILFAVYNGVAALYALLLPRLASLFGRRALYAISLAFGGLGLISLLLFKNPDMLIISMVGVGIAWAAILSIPYAILSSDVPVHKMGIYMGIFNFFIVIPQLTAASILGLLVEHLFAGEAVYALVAGGVSLLGAALLALRVTDKGDIREGYEKVEHAS